MSGRIEWSYWPAGPEDPDPIDPQMAFHPGTSDVWRLWWTNANGPFVATAKCTRIRIIDGTAIMRLRWYDSIRREVKQKSIRWSLPHDLALSRVRLLDRVRLEMAAFKRELFNEVKHHLN